MINKISTISNYSVFGDFNWDSSIRDSGNNIATFKKFNIIYGRNYSGKTSLSRILRCLEKRKLPKKCPDLQFEIIYNTQSIKQNNVDNHSLNIRVYNEDFIKENLSFLLNEEGEIQPFAIVGEKNVEIEKSIKEKQIELGDDENKTGLRYQYSLKETEYKKKHQEREDTENELENKLREKANRDIKENRLYGDVRYEIRKIKNDIKTILKNETQYVLSDDEREEKIKLIKEEAKEKIEVNVSVSLHLAEVFIETEELLKREIKPSRIIKEYIENPNLQEWVRKGIPLHRNKRKICGFCGNNLPDDLWKKLDAHFNKESEELRNSIEKQVQELEEEKINFEQFLTVTEEDFYSFYQNSFKQLKKKLRNEVLNYNKLLDILIKSLQNRLKDIFKVQNVPNISYNTQKIKELADEINNLISESNGKTSTLLQDQENAKRELRLWDIHKFIDDINYKDEIQKIEILKTEEQNLKTEYDEIAQKIKNLEEEIENLKTQLKDERRGAEKINEYLNHYFGHNFLEFKAIDTEEKGVKFRIMRNSDLAFNLSEGERSLIALCYFMAKLEEVETSGKKLIIWLDDPVSSLDNNHIFFTFSLIENIICKPIKNSDGSNSWKYEQLFVSTHNLEFLKYLKQLSQPRNDNQYFLLERVKDRSRLKLLPEYLKKYITEFNYLFHQIYLCSKVEETSENYDLFYNFGNNLRKFLEAYLFYRYPYHTNDKLEKLRMFFGDDRQSVDITNRLTNELSHLEQIFDISLKPIEIPEIPKLAKYVINKIKEKDPEQYKALLKSIGEAN